MDRRYRWFKISFSNTRDSSKLSFVFRGATTSEIRRAGAQKTIEEAGICLLECCVLDIQLHLLEAPVGDRLIKEIYRVSGWLEDSRLQESALAWMKDADGFLEAVSVAMVPGLTLEILDHCDPYDRIRYLLLGRWLYETFTGRSITEVVEPKTQGDPQRGPSEKELHRVSEQRAHEELIGKKPESSYVWTSQGNKVLPDVLPDEWAKG